VEQEECKIKPNKHKKSTKQFDFFYNRSCFRNMCGFYKSNYQSFFEKMNSKQVPDFDKKQGTSCISKA